MDFETPNYTQAELDRQRQEAVGEVKLKESLLLDLQKVAQTNFPHGKFLRDASGNEYILDENGRTIILGKVSDQDDKGFSSIYSPLTPRELQRELLCLSEEQQRQLAEILGLPEPDEKDLAEFKRRQKEREDEQKLLDEALSLPSTFDPRQEEKRVEVDQHLIQGIIQKEYAITNADSEKPIIGTFGLGSCIALTIYDKNTKTATVAHIDGTTSIDSLDRIFYEFQIEKDHDVPLEIRLIGGDHSSRNLAIRILKYLKNKGVKLTSADIMEKEHPLAFVLDSRDGTVVPNIHPIDSGEEEDLRMKASSVAMNAQIKKEFDGR